MEEKKTKNGIIQKLIGKRSEPEFTAQRAWIESTYGEETYEDADVRIENKQKYIMDIIKHRFKKISPNGKLSYSTYHCVIDIEEDIAGYIDQIFEPFVNGGFKIINLSKQVTEINEPHVYLISWKNAFNPVQDTITETEVKLLEE